MPPRSLIALPIAVLAAACSGAADSGNLSVYTRNLSDDGYGMTVASGWLWTRSEGWSRLDDSVGCFGVEPGLAALGRSGGP